MSNLLRTGEDVEALPDGSIISWLRIEGDPTSEAVGIVHSEDDTTWVSPGGWDPLPLSSIGFPAELVRLGSFSGSPYLAEINEVQFSDPDHDRRAGALALAVDFCRDRATATNTHPGYNTALEIARHFDAYVSGDPSVVPKPRFGREVAAFLRETSNLIGAESAREGLREIAEAIEADNTAVGQ